MAKNKKKKPQQQQFLSAEQYLKQRVRQLPVGKCYTTDWDSGEGIVIVSRNHTQGQVTYVAFLVDTYCLGVKNTIYRVCMEKDDLEQFVAKSEVHECSYEEAHNRIYGAIAFAEEAGISPDSSFQIARYILEEDTDDIPLIEYEYGHDGKHLLMVQSRQEAGKYLPLLEKNLGEGNYDFIIGVSNDEIRDDIEDDSEDDIEDDSEDYDNWTDDGEEDVDLQDSSWFENYGPEMEYTYRHPAYPTGMHLHNPWIAEYLADDKKVFNREDPLPDRFRFLPKEELREDLEQIIMYHLGLTCDGIPDGYEPDGVSNWTLSTAVMLLGEVGNDTSSVDVMLEVSRQSEDFFDFHFGDIPDIILASTICKIAQNKLDRLQSFIQEEGLYSLAKSQVFHAVSSIAFYQPGRRKEIVAWFRDALRFAVTSVPEAKSFDSTLAGMLISYVMDIPAPELKPEIKALFDTGLVDLEVCGDYEDVVHEMEMPYGQNDDLVCKLDINDRFAAFADEYN